MQSGWAALLQKIDACCHPHWLIIMRISGETLVALLGPSPGTITTTLVGLRKDNITWISMCTSDKQYPLAALRQAKSEEINNTVCPPVSEQFKILDQFR
mmetsp:Transcript_9442/g.26325  ORF Transcript_9442/g.26325 Transcript_9442/m.26325 type:complete len:99 (-) Transcript_9442:406-702(-)